MWAGHVVRMERHRIPRKVLGSCFGGGRPAERPRNRWEDAVQRFVPELVHVEFVVDKVALGQDLSEFLDFSQ
jgi:hypothetical protein